MMEMTRKHKAMLASRQFGELLEAGVSLRALVDAGARLRDLVDAGANLSALREVGYDTDALLEAGFGLRALLEAGFRLRDLIEAGISLRALREAGVSISDLLAGTPLVEKPYSRMLADIRAGERKHNQETFGPDTPPANLCGTLMCSAGHLVNIAGEAGYRLKDKYGWTMAAALIHEKAHPGVPCQNFGSIRQDLAMAYIEEMAEMETNTKGES